jgi:cytoskeletal protein CcmA (bactofilin family)
MFSRSSERPGSDDGRRGGLQPVGAPSLSAATNGQASVSALTPVATSDQTIVAREDRVEGTIRATKTIRILGTVKGKLEAPNIIIEEGAQVTADISADDVVVAGEYSGNLVCRQRLEVRPSGRLSGRLETLKLMLHEGAQVDGEMHMIKPPVDEGIARVSPSVRGYSESTVRMPVGTGAPGHDQGA